MTRLPLRPRRRAATLALLALLGAGLFAHAQQPLPAAAPAATTVPAPASIAAKGPTLYTVEVLVFRRTGTVAPSSSAEDLTAQSSRSLGSDTDSAAATTDAASVRLGQKLPSSRFRLNDVETRLNSSGGYRSVVHAAWTQTASNWGARSGLTAAQVGLDVAGIDGAIFLERGQYLHLGVNLTIAGNAGTYTLTEMRRVKFNERHYYDHPVYGVIAVVSPATPAATSN